MKETERRQYPEGELRAEEDEKLKGYAARFGSVADIFWFTEEIAPGAFTRTLKERPDVRALIDHDTGRIIGRSNESGSLILREDDTGLAVEIDPPDTTDGRDVRTNIKNKLWSGMSFGFRVTNDEWSTREGKDHRTLLDLELLEVSVVTFPAYNGTSISARSAELVWNEHLALTKKRDHKLDIVKRRIAMRERDMRYLA